MATDCIIRVFDCSIRVCRSFWQPVDWALKNRLGMCPTITHLGHATDWLVVSFRFVKS